jgi:hypothetical protein
MSQDSSVSIVSGYGLDDRAIEVRYPLAEARDFSYYVCVQTGSGANPASCSVCTGGPVLGGKSRPGRDADHSLHLVPGSWMSRSYTFSPSCASIDVLWDCFTLTIISPAPNPQPGGPGLRIYDPAGIGWPSCTPRHWVPILVAFYDMHELQWDCSLIPATTRDVLCI